MKDVETLLSKWDKLFEELKRVVDELIPEMEKSQKEIMEKHGELKEEFEEIKKTITSVSARVSKLEVERGEVRGDDLSHVLNRLENLEKTISNFLESEKREEEEEKKGSRRD